MISQPEKARLRHRRASESYDEKCERRHETRENLRHRNNVTTCRCLGRGAEQPSQSPRQRLFLRRRNLASDAGRTLPGQDPEARVPPEPSSRVEASPLALLQREGGEYLCPVLVSPPQEASRFSPTSPLSSGAAAAKAADPCGFAMVSWHLLDALHPVTTGTKPDMATAPSPPFLTAHFGEMLTWAALSFQHPWSCPTFPPAHSLLSLSVPLGISAGAVPRRGASVNTQGRRGVLGFPGTTAAAAFPSHL
uniref:Uncharacterized protein n=1 Tax=Aquila chrysaetos chrysaetos TaxID=223781 RepID=A0A663F0D3_AQUCH